MKLHFADIWETVADTIPDESALVAGETRRDWRSFDTRAARLAGVLAGSGIGPNAKVAIYSFNGPEFVETQYALFKCRGVAVNVNYRYVENELFYLLDNADAEGVVYQAQFAPRLAAIRGRLPKLKLFLEIADGSGAHLDGARDYEEAIAASPPMERIARSEDDIYMLYTGGTTGMPKGVMYRMGDFVEGLMRAFEVRGIPRPQSPEALADIVRAVRDIGERPTSLPACPLMHGTGLWLGVFQPHTLGAAVVTMDNAHFDPHALWRTVERERVTDISIVGDAFARPMLNALIAARETGKPYDVTSVKRFISSGVMFSLEVKRGLLEFCDATIYDAMGSTEGSMGLSVMSRTTPPAETAKFVMNENTRVFTDDGREVKPGSGEIGMIANGGIVPLAYFKDPEKSARTFRTIAGKRYSFPGDYATVAADGTLVLLGRGSVCINTGGEKVFPEEVEEAVKAHPDVHDCLVVGLPDPRFGERVTAVVCPRENRTIDPGAVIAELRKTLAGYKLPKDIVVMPEVRRAANGKADYKWAKAVAAERLGVGA